MTTFLLIHGMWHGGWCWERLTPLLHDAGYQIHTPTLAGLSERANMRYSNIDLNTHVQDVVDLCKTENLRDVILVGHSLGGFMAHVIADRIPECVAHIVNLDGMVPENGKSIADLIGETWDFFKKKAIEGGDEWWCSPILEWTFGVSGVDPEWAQSKLSPHPLKTLTTPVSLSNPTARSIPRTFILCTDDSSEDEIRAEGKRWTQSGWKFQSILTGHDAMITLPNALANILLELAKETCRSLSEN